MLPGVDIEEDEVDGMLAGRIELADLVPGERESEFVELLDRRRQDKPGS